MNLAKTLYAGALTGALIGALSVTALPAEALQRDGEHRSRSAEGGDRGPGRAQQGQPQQGRAQQGQPQQGQAQRQPRQEAAGRERRGAEASRGTSRDAGRAASPQGSIAVPQGQRFDRERRGTQQEHPSFRSDGFRSGNFRAEGRVPGFRPGQRNDRNYLREYRAYPYTFRPRLRIGFGVYLGYPLAYPAYDAYAYPPVYGYVAPSGYAGYGGMVLDISPDDAAVYVDGQYVGVVNDFYDPIHPLSLGAGRHRVNVQAPGYQVLEFDVNIVAGEVLPYRGDLAPF